MQLMPATAAEGGGHPLSATEITNPDTNTQLGRAHIPQLPRQWDGNPGSRCELLTPAPVQLAVGAHQNWSRTELWAERIP